MSLSECDGTLRIGTRDFPTNRGGLCQKGWTAGVRNSTSTAHRIQTENPMCSENTEKTRLRRAIRAPVARQKTGSSGSQPVSLLLARKGSRFFREGREPVE
jgi:hypothetical protein